MARLYLDWAKKVPNESAEYVAECESVISEGLRTVNAKESLWVMSADVQEWVGDEPGRILALERAVKEQPSAVFPRYLLARAYRQSGQPDKCISVLDPVLKDNPNEVRLCIEYARALEQLGEPYARALGVLGLGTLYGLSDPRFIALYAGMMFMNEQFTEAEHIFPETSKRDFSTYDVNAIHYKPLSKGEAGKFMELNGKVVALRAGYAFIEVPGFPRFYCPSSKQSGITLHQGMSVTFQPGFSAKGNQADKPRVAFTGPEHRKPV